jgi:hypothetical protein
MKPYYDIMKNMLVYDDCSQAQFRRGAGYRFVRDEKKDAADDVKKETPKRRIPTWDRTHNMLVYDDFKEEEHPRDRADGRFAKKSTGSEGVNAKNSLKGAPESGKMNSGKAQSANKTNMKAVEEELYILRQLGEKSGNEYASIMTDDGNMIGSTEGSKSEVRLTANMQRQLDSAPPNSIVFVHNHPHNSGFSDDDLSVLAHPSVKEMRVVTPDGTHYAMIVGNGRRPTKAEIINTGKRLDGDVENKLGPMIRSGQISPQQAGLLHSVVKGDLFAKEYGWKYERGRVDR